jgi:hypothetical protein
MLIQKYIQNVELILLSKDYQVIQNFLEIGKPLFPAEFFLIWCHFLYKNTICLVKSNDFSSSVLTLNIYFLMD